MSYLLVGFFVVGCTGSAEKSPDSVGGDSDSGVTDSTTDSATTDTGDTGTFSPQVWDLAAEFSADTNPSGPYTYGWSATLPVDLTAFGATSPGGEGDCTADILNWYDPAFNLPPAIAKNMGASDCFTIPPGWLNLHPGPAGEYAVVRWTSPVAANVSIQGEFSAGDVAALSYYVLIDDQIVYSLIATEDSGPFDLTQPVSAGSTVDFLVGEGFAYGTTPFSAVITTVP